MSCETSFTNFVFSSCSFDDETIETFDHVNLERTIDVNEKQNFISLSVFFLEQIMKHTHTHEKK
jgi:hypothetical protein